MVVVASGLAATRHWGPRRGFVNGDCEPAFAITKPGICSKLPVEGDSGPTGLITQPRRQIEIAADNDVRLLKYEFR